MATLEHPMSFEPIPPSVEPLLIPPPGEPTGILPPTLPNYNSSSIDVDPWVINSASSTVNDAVKSISEHMTAINNALNELRLSWVGDSSDEADKFNNDWNDVAQKLYGTEAAPELGVLNKITNGLATAAVAYSHGERTVSNTFAAFQAALEGVDVTNLPDDTDLETWLWDQDVPAADSNTDDYTDQPPAENTVIDGPEAYPAVAPGLDSPDPYVHTTAVDQTF
ncbi:WXG100 family type VII secretion target [Actinoallomurus sp. NPDC052308]|uniref:WXG100 family type VII secretion target n=1 Tax=Actinoallomurus sp. NPDC052308 TaxID=3155530 RepID=UPI00344374DC